ncbi:type II secretion system minor pseudopilin GspK [Agitococcus lubricus]|uniref:Type II secretion system protein K n=1 Tax=Agitococcus lubricus TaxID=1077255 RepID=A0A2T5IWL7_9GAMM|nr:type II secretion system minor pseudopilin GspK [Agitococcus lubricus]PTQ88284.1 general secretion pathway protein K [Agitococcus lubricus]
MRIPLKQRGVALLTVLLVVAMATILAVAMVKSQQSFLRRSSSVFSQDQAYLYTLGAESFAKSIIQEDKDNDQNKTNPQDALNENWAKRVPPFPVEGGYVLAQIDDLQAKFNLNNLWQEGQLNTAALTMYMRLLASLDISPALASPLVDWLDPDNLPYDGDGAEEDWYLRLKPAYRTANHALVSTSELLLLRGYTPEIVAKLQPHITALPTFTTININTASAEVLVASADNLTLNMAKELVNTRPKEGFGSVELFLANPIFSNISADEKQNMTKMLGVRTQYFRVLAEAEIDLKRRVLSVTIARDDSSTIRTISRDWSQQWQTVTQQKSHIKDTP